MEKKNLVILGGGEMYSNNRAPGKSNDSRYLNRYISI